jgi:hypothetical protein
MSELFQIVGFFAFAAAVAFALSYLLFRLPLRRVPFGLSPGALVRIRTSSGVHRTRFNGLMTNGLSFADPLQRDSYVPLKMGEVVTVEAPLRDGVLMFRSMVASRDVETHEIVLEAPVSIYRQDRRDANRKVLNGRTISVEGRPASLIDLSENGVRFARNGPLEKGERIRFEFEDGIFFGWVLECLPNFDPGDGTHVIRARFEEPLKISLA